VTSTTTRYSLAFFPHTIPYFHYKEAQPAQGEGTEAAEEGETLSKEAPAQGEGTEAAEEGETLSKEAPTQGEGTEADEEGEALSEEAPVQGSQQYECECCNKILCLHGGSRQL